jgi:hypothetical protein
MSGTDVVVRTDGRTVVRSDGAPTAAPANYAEEQRRAVQANQITFAVQKELAHYVHQHSDPNGFIQNAAILSAGNGALSSGYTLPEGVAVNAQEAYDLLSVAREAGVPQECVTRFFEIMGRRQRH